jgi:hypothetical protein
MAITPVRASLTPLDNVLVVHKGVNAADRKAPYDVFPGSSNDLRILRLVRLRPQRRGCMLAQRGQLRG